MQLTSGGAVLAALLAASCSSSAGIERGTPSAPPTTAATPSTPADAVVFDGASTTIPIAADHGSLRISVESKRTPHGVTVTLRANRKRDCHLDNADGEAEFVVCSDVYDRRKTIPAEAFTYDSTLGTASLTSTVEGKRLVVMWSGHGEVQRATPGGEGGVLLVEQRAAKGTAQWGTVKHTDSDGTSSPSHLYRRVTAST